MKISRSFLCLFVFVALVIAACSKDCEDKKVGTIPPPDRYFNFFLHDEGDVVQYEKSDGTTITFSIDTLDWSGRVNLREIGTGSHSQNGTYSCYEYLSTSWGVIQFEEPEENTTLQIIIIASGATEASLQYVVEVNASWIERMPEQVTGWTSGQYNFTKEEFVEDPTTTAEHLATWEANGKVFNDVMKFKSAEGELYFVEGLGIVGFTRIDNELYTLVN